MAAGAPVTPPPDGLILQEESTAKTLHPLLVACLPHPWSESSLQYTLRDPLSRIYTLLNPANTTRPIACLIWHTLPDDTAEILMLCVHPEQQRRGYARYLLECVVQDLKAHNIHTLWLEVAVDNASAHACYQTMGFVTQRLRPNYYQRGEVRVDAAILRLDLG